MLRPSNSRRRVKSAGRAKIGAVVRTQAVTILFCDLVASTERRARLGDDDFDKFTARFMTVLRTEIAAYGGRVVSSAGDGLMVVFVDSVADAVACATAMHRGVAPLDPGDPPLLRIGISCGEVAQDGDDFSGMPIVEAARLEAAAAPGKTLASAVIRSLVGTRRAFRFRDVGALELKGLPSPLTTVEVVDEEIADIPTAIPTKVRRPRHTKVPMAAAIGALVIATAGGAFVIAGRGADDKTALKGITPPTAYTPRLEPTACYDPNEAKTTGEICAWLVVPQDREKKPSGKQIRLLVSRIPARKSVSGADPTIDLCDCEDIETSPTRDHAELIKTQLRGYGLTKPALTCPEMHAASKAALARPTNDRRTISEGRDALTQCYRRLVADGIDPAQYNFDAAAQDVLDLMVALHIRRADFITQDTQSVQIFDVVRRAPAAVRSLTLSNPAPPGTTAFTNPTDDLAGAFGRYVALCADNPTCARAYPDLQRQWRARYDRFDARPVLVAHPDFHDDPSTPAIPLLVEGPRAADGLAAVLDADNLHNLLAAGVTDPSGTSIVGAATGAQTNPGFAIYPDAEWGAYASYVCSYDIHTVDANIADLTARKLPQFVRSFYAHWSDGCDKAWKVPSLLDTLSVGVGGSVPALLFRGELSSTGNDTWIDEIRRDLPNAQSVSFATASGGLLEKGPPCLSDLRRKFLADPTAKLDTAACANQSPPIRFVTPT